MGTTPPTPGSDPATDLCASVEMGMGIVNGKDATVASHMFHGTPTNTPVDPRTNYLYSGADQHIITFPSADRAKAAFDYAKQVTAQHGCTFKDTSGVRTTRTITVGAVTASGFSILIDDKPGPSYEHAYFVLKGTHVTTLIIGFEHGDSTTAGDAAVLSAMTARLP